jgi:DNA gyrase subunit A
LQVLAVCEKGYGKRTPLEEFRTQNRGGRGVILIDASERNGPVVGIALVRPQHDVMFISDRGKTIRTKIGEIRETGRNAQGVRVMSLEEGERVVALEALPESDDAAVGGDGAGNDGSNGGPVSTPSNGAPPTDVN